MWGVVNGTDTKFQTWTHFSTKLPVLSKKCPIQKPRWILEFSDGKIPLQFDNFRLNSFNVFLVHHQAWGCHIFLVRPSTSWGCHIFLIRPSTSWGCHIFLIRPSSSLGVPYFFQKRCAMCTVYTVFPCLTYLTHCTYVLLCHVPMYLASYILLLCHH